MKNKQRIIMKVWGPWDLDSNLLSNKAGKYSVSKFNIIIYLNDNMDNIIFHALYMVYCYLLQ